MPTRKRKNADHFDYFPTAHSFVWAVSLLLGIIYVFCYYFPQKA